jgi:hypothetical protein
MTFSFSKEEKIEFLQNIGFTVKYVTRDEVVSHWRGLGMGLVTVENFSGTVPGVFRKDGAPYEMPLTSFNKIPGIWLNNAFKKELKKRLLRVLSPSQDQGTQADPVIGSGEAQKSLGSVIEYLEEVKDLNRSSPPRIYAMYALEDLKKVEKFLNSLDKTHSGISKIILEAYQSLML